MNRLLQGYQNLPRQMKIEAAVALVLTIGSLISIPVIAWFSSEQKMGDLERVDAPTKLYITAAHDDIKYLQLVDIKVSGNTDKKYYVFCISGDSVSSYDLQLAYTTNNQFEYFIYPAEQVGYGDDYLAKNTLGVDYLASHTAHNADGEETVTYCYAIDKHENINKPDNSFTGDAHYRLWNGTTIREDTTTVTTRFLNKANDTDLIANNTKHNATYNYKNYDSVGEENIGVQLYCEPVYWQALNIKSGMDASNTFENYYILEVNWEQAKAAAGSEGLKDDKETDIIYIAARASS